MANPFTAAREYIRHSVAELQKVTWPSREMTLRFSALVIVVSVAFAAFFAALDFGLNRLVDVVVVNRGASAVPQPVEPPAVVPDLEAVDENGNPIDAQVLQQEPAGGTPAANGGDLTLPALQ